MIPTYSSRCGYLVLLVRYYLVVRDAISMKNDSRGICFSFSTDAVYIGVLLTNSFLLTTRSYIGFLENNQDLNLIRNNFP